jgi:uncharacterized membrane protein YebE (DUF533 family)
MAELNETQRDLAALIERIFADGVIDPAERQTLQDFWRQRGLTVPQVRQVVDAFVARVWGEVIADGVVTAEERGRLNAVVQGLRLPEEALPGPVRKALP